MSSKLKRRAISPELVAKASPFHSSVTLFTASEATEDPDLTRPSLRRSKRVKREETTATVKEEEAEIIAPAAVKRKRKTVVASSSAVKLEEVGKEIQATKATPKKPKVIKKSLDVPHAAPPRWQEAYDIIKRMRANIVAPVDTMGCDQAQYKESDPKNRRFATLISLMLSSQTKDEVTDAAVSKLREAVGGSLSVDALININESAISEAIAKVGFWRRKTQYIKQASQILKDKFNSDVPKTVDELCSLPGVGPKMAFLALQVAWNINVGIGVDVHVHRITNRLGWHKPPTKNPEETRLNLQSWLPQPLHPEINHLLVGFGQTICLPTNPRCNLCDLSDTGLCPSVKIPKTRTTTKSSKVATLASGPKLEIELEDSKELIPMTPSVKVEEMTEDQPVSVKIDPDVRALSPLSELGD
ncbi:Endonuclease III [Abortiporus biennis]